MSNTKKAILTSLIAALGGVCISEGVRYVCDEIRTEKPEAYMIIENTQKVYKDYIITKEYRETKTPREEETNSMLQMMRMAVK